MSFFSKSLWNTLRTVSKSTVSDTARVTIGFGVVYGGYYLSDQAKQAFFKKAPVPQTLEHNFKKAMK